MMDQMRMAQPEELTYETAAVVIDRVPSPNYAGEPQLYFTLGGEMLSVTHRGEWTWFQTQPATGGGRELGHVKAGGPDERYARDFEGEKRTPASDEAYRFTDRDEAESARTRATDRVIASDAE